MADKLRASGLGLEPSLSTPARQVRPTRMLAHVIVTLVSGLLLMCSLFIYHEYCRARLQQIAVEQLRKRGFEVLYDWQWDFAASTSREPSLIRRTIGNNLFADVVIVSGGKLRDMDTTLICQFPKLVEIESIPTDDVSDNGLERLRRLKHLRRIPALRSQRITDRGVNYLAELPQLEALSIAGHITDAGLAKLAKMTSLQVLEVLSPDITDFGVLQFRQSTHLKGLYLGGGTVTNAAIQSLRNSNKGLIVDYRPVKF